MRPGTLWRGGISKINLVPLIKSVLLSWQVIAAAIAFIVLCVLLSVLSRPAGPPKKPKPRKVKRPEEKSSELPDDADTKDLGLE